MLWFKEMSKDERDKLYLCTNCNKLNRDLIYRLNYDYINKYVKILKKKKK